MAKDKNSFVAYTDWNTTFEKLSDEEAGKLAKMMFAFVSDQNPEAPDRMTELLFDPIKSQLKRDLKSYEKALDENSRKGRMGNLKRWHSDLYAKVTFEKLTLEEAEEIAKGRTCDKNIATAKNLSQKIADTVYDNEDDTDNDILLEKETKEILSDFEKDIDDHLKIPTSVNSQTKEAKKVAPKKVTEILHIPEDFISLWNDWTEYRKLRKFKAYASPKYEQMAVDKLLELSGCDPIIASKILQNTFTNNYQGFFPLKENSDGKTNSYRQAATGTIQPARAKRR